MYVYMPSTRWFSEWLDGYKAGYFYNFALDIMMDDVRVALYHDTPTNCPTWVWYSRYSGDCRCMVEPL